MLNAGFGCYHPCQNYFEDLHNRAIRENFPVRILAKDLSGERVRITIPEIVSQPRKGKDTLRCRESAPSPSPKRVISITFGDNILFDQQGKGAGEGAKTGQTNNDLGPKLALLIAKWR